MTGRAGGWGEVFDDEGSGYWTATRGLNACSRMVGGRAPDGPLRRAMREAVGADTDLDVVGIVIDRWAGQRGRVAALSRVVTAAADDGDAAALAILDRAGAELAASPRPCGPGSARPPASPSPSPPRPGC